MSYYPNSTNSTTQKNVIQLPIPFWIFLSTETLVTIFGNAMLCCLFFGNKKLRTNQNYFIVSLSVSDLLVGLSIVPCEYCRVVSNIQTEHHNTDKRCPLFCGSIFSFNMIASVINLVLIASDRYFSIMKPFRYVELFSKKRAIFIILISWLTTIVLTCIPLLWAFEGVVDKKIEGLINVGYTGVLFSLAILAGISLTLSYYKIVKTVRIKLRESREPPSNPAGVKVCIISSIIFFVSWIPYCVVEVLMQQPHLHIPEELMDAAYFNLILSPCLDPLLYAYYRKDFRKCLVACCRRYYVPLKQACDRIVAQLNCSERKCLLKGKYGRKKNTDEEDSGYDAENRVLTVNATTSL